MYKLEATGRGIIRQSDKAFIPEAAGNVDWRDYLAWLAVTELKREGKLPGSFRAVRP
jgi:hypothetical protein